MSHVITFIAIVYVAVVAIYLAYAPEEDFALLVVILIFVVPFVFLAISVDKIRRVLKRLHPVLALVLVMLVGIFIVLASQPVGDSVPYLVIFVILVLPMLIISLCMNFGWSK